VPALVNGASEVLKGHCLRGNGGLYYENEAEFIEALKLLRQQPSLRAQLGRQGQAYVQQRYNWERIEADYVSFLQHL
jgi:glycosyltransferase involved in cell wall biosynthesis